MFKFRLFQLDVKNDFINDYLNEGVFVEQPKRFIDPNFSDHVYKLAQVFLWFKARPDELGMKD